ncbi:MAG: hypothetical protein ACOYXM_18740, partial [Actinomycetota bacterium]
MLVLLSFALVLVATVLLVLGLLSDDGLTMIYISIASSVGAAIVLYIALRLNKPQAAVGTADATVLLPEPALVGAGAASSAPPSVDLTEQAPEPAPVEGEWLASEQDDWPAEDDAWEEGDEVEFPIADYDTLSVGQILPLLPQLYTDEIDVVEQRERDTKARPQVLAKLAELRDAPESTDPLASYTESPAVGGWEEEEWFPIEDYESLSAAQIMPLLPELDDEELTLVRTRELSLGRRRSLLDEIDRRLGIAAAPATTRKASPPKAASKPAARKTASKPAAAKRAPSRSSTAKAPAKTTAKSTASAKKAAA